MFAFARFLPGHLLQGTFVNNRAVLGSASAYLRPNPNTYSAGSCSGLLPKNLDTLKVSGSLYIFESRDICLPRVSYIKENHSSKDQETNHTLGNIVAPFGMRYPSWIPSSVAECGRAVEGDVSDSTKMSNQQREVP